VVAATVDNETGHMQPVRLLATGGYNLVDTHLQLGRQLQVSEQLRMIPAKVEVLLQALYREMPQPKTSYDDFFTRICTGAHNVIFHNRSLPTHMAHSFNGGGSDCVITKLKHSRTTDTPKRMDDIRTALIQINFTGQFIYSNGGFVEPTGMELKFAGVPYVVKIFEMMFAELAYGCDSVLWIDSTIVPKSGFQRFFDHMHSFGSYVTFYTGDVRLILPSTRYLLQRLTGTDVLRGRSHLMSQVFGFKMSSPLVRLFINDYYDMAERGTPFLSCYPEEFVMGAIIRKPIYAPLTARANTFLKDYGAFHRPH
jgi:hypothetical protein